MSRSIRGRHPNRRKKYNTSHTYHAIDYEDYRLARQPKPSFGDEDDGPVNQRGESLDRYFWRIAHEKVFRGGPDGHHSQYHQALSRKLERKQRRAKRKQSSYREVRDEFSLDGSTNLSIVGSTSMESPVAEFLVIEVEADGDDGLTHLSLADTWEAAVEEAKTEGRLEGPTFRPGPLIVTDWMVRACRNEIADKLDGLTVSNEDMRAIIAGDVELRRCLLTSYSEGDSGGDHTHGLDTYDREYLLEAFATFIGSNEGWPIMMADEEERDFFLTLVKEAAQSGKLKQIEATA